MQNISINKHEYNVRRVEELDSLIIAKEKELRKTSGLINIIKAKIELKKLYKDISVHGKEVLEFENKQTLSKEY